MFDDILRIFDFLSPKQTEETYPSRKPMAIPVDEPLKVIRHCQQIFQKLDVLEADVLKRIDNPEQAWPFLNKIRQIRRETQNDLLSLLPEGHCLLADDSSQYGIPVRSINTGTGTTLKVFNGGLAD
ncbi:hypothetical protein [Methylomonas koyamae]|uniref:hypothetical protein n=1 Tax=Methylomonas koyamae TaxID=702114 RepID=UPI0006CF4846|nr:hypothetical protein [Methylomonas koyamae]BBL57482.1 hypothetical protein MKFW12EY_10950 [Methylomonas koyamae]